MCRLQAWHRQRDTFENHDEGDGEDGIGSRLSGNPDDLNSHEEKIIEMNVIGNNVIASGQYSAEECQLIEEENTCLICDEENDNCSWVQNVDNGCYTFCCQECYENKDSDDPGCWGMRGCCMCGESKIHSLIMGSCVCEKYFNLCTARATEGEEGEWYCGEGNCVME